VAAEQPQVGGSVGRGELRHGLFDVDGVAGVNGRTDDQGVLGGKFGQGMPERGGCGALPGLDALGAATGSINEMVEIDLDFHRTMCTLTDNAALVRSWGGIADSIRMSIMFAGTDRALGNMSVPRHQVLGDAVAAGDPDQARIAVEEHMREAANSLMTASDTGNRDTA